MWLILLGRGIALFLLKLEALLPTPFRQWLFCLSSAHLAPTLSAY